MENFGKIKITIAELMHFHKRSRSTIDKYIQTVKDINNNKKDPYILDNYCSAHNIDIEKFKEYFEKDRYEEIKSCEKCAIKKPCRLHKTAFNLLPYPIRIHILNEWKNESY
jgi:hypothetical protein